MCVWKTCFIYVAYIIRFNILDVMSFKNTHHAFCWYIEEFYIDLKIYRIPSTAVRYRYHSAGAPYKPHLRVGSRSASSPKLNIPWVALANKEASFKWFCLKLLQCILNSLPADLRKTVVSTFVYRPDVASYSLASLGTFQKQPITSPFFFDAFEFR